MDTSTMAKTREALGYVLLRVKIQLAPMLHSLHCISLLLIDIDYELLCAYEYDIGIHSDAINIWQ